MANSSIRRTFEQGTINNSKMGITVTRQRQRLVHVDGLGKSTRRKRQAGKEKHFPASCDLLLRAAAWHIAGAGQCKGALCRDG